MSKTNIISLINDGIRQELAELGDQKNNEIRILHEEMARSGRISGGTPCIMSVQSFCSQEIKSATDLICKIINKFIKTSGEKHSEELSIELKKKVKENFNNIGNYQDRHPKINFEARSTSGIQFKSAESEINNERNRSLDKINTEIDLLMLALKNDKKKSAKNEKKIERLGSTMKTSPSSTKIWDEIQREEGITKRAFGKKINFVSDKFKRKILFRDIEQAYMLAKSGFCKPAVILSGGVIEELLRLYLDHHNVDYKGKTFDSYIKACADNGLIKISMSRLSDSVRHFRNLVHIAREGDKSHTISKSAANGAISSIFTIANDF